MKKLTKSLLAASAGLLLGAQATLLTGCNDDLAADSYYTFTGEMMSDYLDRPDFSLFKRIVERADRMDLLASRGARTLFPPTNEGVEKFLAEKGYASVEDIPQAYCDTLVRAALIERIRYTYNFQETVQENNELDLPLIIVTNGDTVDANGMTLSIINHRAAIINELKNDSVENGVIHPVDQVVLPNTSLGSELLDQNHKDFTIFYEAMKRTGLLDSLVRYRDENYEIRKEHYPEFQHVFSGGVWVETDQGYPYHAKRPDHRYEGFTVLIVPDNVLYEKYSERFNESMTMDEKVNALYDLAVEKYQDEDAAAIFGLNTPVPGNPEGKTYKELYWNRESLTSRQNPLNMFLSYHILDRQFASTAKLINCWGVRTNYIDPTEWISTMLDFSTIKLEKVYSMVDNQVGTSGDFYVNHSAATVYNAYERVRGAKLSTPEGENFSLNLAYYYLDDIVAYDQTMRNNVMHTRMRIDFVTLWPELTNNNIRMCGNLFQAYSESVDNSENGGESGGFNYYIPPGYM